MSMFRRLAREIPQLQSKTLARDGLALEDNTEESTAAIAAAASAVATTTTAASAKAAKRPPSGNGGSPSTSFVMLLAGPQGSPFEGGVFRLQIDVPAQYPLEPPKIIFKTRIFHPNVGCGHTPGAICLDILRKEAWSPALTLERTLISIASLMADPNPASPMNSDAAKLFENDREAYNRRVKEWVKSHATTGDASGSWTGDLGKDETGNVAPAAIPTSRDASAAMASLPPSRDSAAAVAPPDSGNLGLFEPVVIDLSDDEPASKRSRGK